MENLEKRIDEPSTQAGGLHPNLRNQIRAYLDGRKAHVEREKEQGKKKHDFVSSLASIFNSPEVIELLKVTAAEICLFAHYGSSMGAAITGSPPNYEIVVSGEGIVEKRDGKSTNKIKLPAGYKTWEEIIPYGGLFHDSSSGDYTFEPDREDYTRDIEEKLLHLLKVE